MKFTDLKSWEIDQDGNAKLQLSSPDGTFREATFSRPLMAALIIVLNRFLMDTSDKFPEGLREILLAQVPMEASASHLSNGGYALTIKGQAGTTHHFPIEGDAMTVLSSALSDLQAILTAESVGSQVGRH